MTSYQMYFFSYLGKQGTQAQLLISVCNIESSRKFTYWITYLRIWRNHSNLDSLGVRHVNDNWDTRERKKYLFQHMEIRVQAHALNLKQKGKRKQVVAGWVLEGFFK